MKPQEHQHIKGCLVAAALFFGMFIGMFAMMLLATIRPVLSLLGPLIGIGAALLYVALAATVVNWIMNMRAWAYCGAVERPDDAYVLTLAAVWPLALFPAALLYLFLGVVNRTFDKR